MKTLKTIQSPWCATHGVCDPTTGRQVFPDTRFPVLQSRSGLTGYAGVYPADSVIAHRGDALPENLPEVIWVFSGHWGDFCQAHPVPRETVLDLRAAWKRFRETGEVIPLREETPVEVFAGIRRWSLYLAREYGHFLTPAEGMPHDGEVWHDISSPDHDGVIADRDGVLFPAPNGWNFRRWDEVSPRIAEERLRLFPETGNQF